MWMQVTLVSSDQYFGGGRLAVLDQLGSAGTYFPWGEDKGSTNPQNAWSFATYWRDSGTNLDYANNRYYSNAYGRFMTPDPSTNSRGPGDPQNWNRYAYTAGDPVNRLDPTGLDYELVCSETTANNPFENSGFDIYGTLNISGQAVPVEIQTMPLWGTKVGTISSPPSTPPRFARRPPEVHSSPALARVPWSKNYRCFQSGRDHLQTSV